MRRSVIAAVIGAVVVLGGGATPASAGPPVKRVEQGCTTSDEGRHICTHDVVITQRSGSKAATYKETVTMTSKTTISETAGGPVTFTEQSKLVAEEQWKKGVQTLAKERYRGTYGPVGVAPCRQGSDVLIVRGEVRRWDKTLDCPGPLPHTAP